MLTKHRPKLSTLVLGAAFLDSSALASARGVADELVLDGVSDSSIADAVA